MNHNSNSDYMLQFSPEAREKHEQIFLALCIQESREKCRGERMPINQYRLREELLSYKMTQDEHALVRKRSLTLFTDDYRKRKKPE